MEADVQAMSFDLFAGHVRETFSVQLGESNLDLTLLDAQRKPTRDIAGLRAQPFALYFKSQSQVVLPQRTYAMRNAALGTLNLFIVPVARDRDGIVYEALFN